MAATAEKLKLKVDTVQYLHQTVLRNTASRGKIDGCKQNGTKLLCRITDGTLHLQCVLISSFHVRIDTPCGSFLQNFRARLGVCFIILRCGVDSAGSK
jgi:hypothetical protein